MDPSQRERLSQLVEELTTSGEPQLHQDKMKEVKKICRLSTDCVDHVFRSLMSQLNQDHAEIRLSAFQVSAELFSRSHHFRTLLVDNFQEFLELTVETDLEQPLPPPKEVSRKLKALAVQTVQAWQAAYGSAYKKLALGYHFLKQVKKVDFQDAEARTVAERRREEERRGRMDRIYRERVEAATKDMDGQDGGAASGVHLKETEDNEPLVSTAIDLHRLITTKHLPAVQGWVQLFTRSGADQQLLRRALDLKASLEAALQKHQELHIDCKTRVRRVMKAGDEEDEDDDDFDEVPEKEGYEPHIPEHLRAEYGLDPSPSTSTAPVTQKRPAAAPPPPSSSTSSSSSSSRRLKRLLEEEQDPTSAVATLRLLRQKLPVPAQASTSSGPGPSQSSSDQKARDAPVVPFGLDLYYWGQEQPNAGKIVKAASQHQFWVPSEVEEEVENKDLLAESKTRYISFPGSFSPVSHSCRAPLGGGKLCPRQDRLKCPFHGRIVPRDDEGRPCRPEDRAREEQEERRRRETQPPDWFDPQLMRDIEASTGEDLGSDRVPGKRGKRKKKKKFPNLSDLKQSSNTARSRLERKVFNKSSMRRMAQVMNKADRRKHEKFSNQFNYALN